MSRWTKRLVGFGILLTLALVMAACTGATQATEPPKGPAPTTAATQAPQVVPTCPAAPTCPTAVPAEQGVVAPFEEQWAASPHNDAEALAFTDWNESEDQMVPANCAKCHSTTGYVDFLGGDGSEAGSVDNPVPIGTTVTCDACHAPAATALQTVTFPSGAEIGGLGPEARCMVCHQGRASKVQVDAQVEKFAAEDPDAVVEPITEGDNTQAFSFINIHYYAAAATLYGKEAMGGYQYDGKSYDAKFDHVEGYNTCVGCHDPHTTEVKVEQCALCHEGVASKDDLKKIRMVSSAPDYDGDGNVEEGMYDEITGLRETLLTAIMAYAKDTAGTGILYDDAAYPYFFTDADNDGTADVGGENNAAMRFEAWTPRLLKAAYNFQVATKDPGAYAHGNKYIVQLLYDSLEDLGGQVTSIDMTAMHREDAGHFAGDTEAFRHWDAEEGKVPGSCAKCHTATGLPQFLTEGANITNRASNGLLCSSCHDEANWPATYAVADVTFPSGAKVTFGEGVSSNLCLVCHQGRESTVSVDKAVTGLDEAPSDKIRFRNVHYFAAGATLFGTEVKGIYEYEGKEYAGRFMHTEGFDTCASCHDPHALNPKVETCKGCHGTDDPSTIRMTLKEDYDGDGDTTEGLKGEIEGMTELLYAALQNYATNTAQAGILYDAHAYPYFFLDKDGNGEADLNDEGAPSGFNAFTPKLLKAAYNFQYAQKDPGAYVHNASYVMQALYDSIQDLGGDVTKLTRPTTTSAPAQ